MLDNLKTQPYSMEDVDASLEELDLVLQQVMSALDTAPCTASPADIFHDARTAAYLHIQPAIHAMMRAAMELLHETRRGVLAAEEEGAEE